MAVTESMGASYDRTGEHLGTTDKASSACATLLRKRRCDLANGIDPPATEVGHYNRVFSAEKMLAPARTARPRDGQRPHLRRRRPRNDDVSNVLRRTSPDSNGIAQSDAVHCSDRVWVCRLTCRVGSPSRY